MVKKFKQPAAPVEKTLKHKSKTPKTLLKSITDSVNAEDQKVPGKFRRMLAWQNRKPETGKVGKKSSISRKKETSVEEQLAVLHHETALAGKRKTKKYLKKKAFLDSRKHGSTVELSRGEIVEKRLEQAQKVRFGDVVQAPPQLTLPKLRKTMIKKETPPKVYLKKKIPDARPIKDLVDKEKVGRSRKLKSLPEAERAALLQEREKVIAHYRSKRQKPMDSS